MQRAPFPPRKSLTLSAWVFYFCPTHPPCGGSGVAAGGLSRVWTALLQQRSWLSHLRAKVFSQEPTVEAALKGAQHGTSTSDEGNRGRAPAGHTALIRVAKSRGCWVPASPGVTSRASAPLLLAALSLPWLLLTKSKPAMVIGTGGPQAAVPSFSVQVTVGLGRILSRTGPWRLLRGSAAENDEQYEKVQ